MIPSGGWLPVMIAAVGSRLQAIPPFRSAAAGLSSYIVLFTEHSKPFPFSCKHGIVTPSSSWRWCLIRCMYMLQKIPVSLESRIANNANPRCFLPACNYVFRNDLQTAFTRSQSAPKASIPISNHNLQRQHFDYQQVIQFENNTLV
ncbi:hypothetical protein F5Y18DRAFT_355338 [Xylariaceae sp. FL1019]|nr:hypothetical protein F5Y18DRAFT_355338 [Xylariaceae sp. FL1019]